MNYLPNEILIEIYSKLYTHHVMPELNVQCERVLILNCVKETPYEKTISYISKSTNICASIVSRTLDNNAKILRHFNNMYNIDTYIHIDNQI